MIEYRRGNLFESGAAALVNTVNEVGVMRKGFALMFRDAFPANTAAYLEAVRTGEVRVGRMFVTENRTPGGPAWIVNFPTKKHWRNPSKLEWIREGLRDLVRVVTERNIRSVALPPCGCGSGGLAWAVIRREIEGEFSGLTNVHVLVFEPADTAEAPEPAGSQALAPAPALILEMVRRYAVLGLDCTSFEVQKLTWFLDRSIRTLDLRDPLGLQFAARKYGPYAGRLTEVIDGLTGTYLSCEKRRGQAGPFDRIWFEDDRRDALAAALEGDQVRPYQPALARAAEVIDGFESPLGLELLATVDWLLARDRVAPTRPAVKAALRSWPGGRPSVARKLRLFDDRRLDLALKRLAGRSPAGDRPAATGRSS